MSHAATNWAIQQRGLRPIAKLLLWNLADCHNPVAGCYPTQGYLAEQCEISRASVNRYLADLEAAGAIRREQRVDPSSKRQRPTRYFLAFEPEFATPDVVGRVSGGDTGAVSQNPASRVSETVEAVSQSYETLTCKGTKKDDFSILKGRSALPQRDQELVVAGPGDLEFEAVSKLRRLAKRPAPVIGKSGRTTFARSEVDDALAAFPPPAARSRIAAGDEAA